MLASLRAELLILRRRRAAWALVLVVPILTWISRYAVPYVQYRTETPDQYAFYGTPEQTLATLLPDQFVIVAVGQYSFAGAAPFAVLGALIAGTGWASGTLDVALLQRPVRVATLAGQAGALLVAVTVAVAATFAVSGATSVLIALAETGSAAPLPSPGVLAHAVGAGVLSAATSGAAGLLLGTVLRNAGGAVAVVLLWTALVQPLLDTVALQAGGVWEIVNDALPNAAAVSVSDVFGAVGGGPDTPVYSRVDPALATWILLAYLLGFLGLAALALVRRDIGPASRARLRRSRWAERGRGAAISPASGRGEALLAAAGADALVASPGTVRPAVASGGALLAAVRAELLVAARRPTLLALAAIPTTYVVLSGFGLPWLFSATAGSGRLTGLSPALILPTLQPDHLVATVMGALGGTPGLGFDATASFLVVGGLLAGTDWEHGTIRTALLQAPGRLTTFAGQAIALAAIVIAAVGATFLLGAAASLLVGLVEAGSPYLSPEAGLFPPAIAVGSAFGAAVLIGTAYGAIGLALGTAFRSVSGPVAVALLWAVVVQPQLGTLAGQAGGVVQAIDDVLPSGSVTGLVHAFAPVAPLMSNPTGPPLDPTTAAWALVAYAVLFLGAPAVLLRRRDVA